MLYSCLACVAAEIGSAVAAGVVEDADEDFSAACSASMNSSTSSGGVILCIISHCFSIRYSTEICSLYRDAVLMLYSRLYCPDFVLRTSMVWFSSGRESQSCIIRASTFCFSSGREL